VIFVLLLSSLSVIAQEHGERGEEGEGGFAGALGSLAVFLLAVGFVYVVARRSFVYSKYLDAEFDHVKESIRTTYKKYRKPLLNFHSIVLIVATVVAGVHGVLLMNGEGANLLAGWAAFGAMVLLSISGIIIYFRFKPIWEFRKSKGLLKLVHRQWLFTIIGAILLLIHVAD
jgi:hypothetical protein